MKHPVVFECETKDPDDFLTLLWLVDHPSLELVGVLVTPGTQDQTRLVRWALDQHSCKIEIGIREDYPNPERESVSPFHYDVYGAEIRSYEAGPTRSGAELLAELIGKHPSLTVVSGAAPKILGATFRRYPEIRLARWVMQGAFAGDDLVAPEHRLEKFVGKRTCPSYNPGGAPKETLELLATDRIARRLFVSKNVCHGVVWTPDMQQRLRGHRPGLRTMIHGLDRYLADKGVGKAMHDVVAATCVLDETVCTFTEVEIYREKGEWGANAKPGTNTFISVAIDMDKFVATLSDP